MEWHLAEALEAVAQAIPDETALVNGTVRRTWREYDQRAAALAAALASSGLGEGAKIGLLAYNSIEYLEAHFAAFKLRAVPVNVNYRYAEEELVYLLTDADAEALVFDAAFAPRIAAIRRRLPLLKVFVEIDDGSGEHLADARRFEDAIAEGSTQLLPKAAYSPDDVYMIYSGGTTGMPKGVMYRHGDFARAMLTGYSLHGQATPNSPAEIAECARRLRAAGSAPTGLAACPLMHGVGLWAGAYMCQLMGGKAVTFRNTSVDAHDIWRIVERERVSFLALVGDAFARPLVDAFHEATGTGRPYDVSPLKLIFSSGVMFSRETKAAILEFADVTLLDSMAASEGAMAVAINSRARPPGETATFQRAPTTKVFDEDDREVTPGSDRIGRIATGSLTPIGYYKDPAKSGATFRVIDGQRFSFSGDFAKVAADGSLILLGRGSACINTGGEKVFPEEVEEALKAHPDVADALVVGMPDKRLGQTVVAVVSHRAGTSLDVSDLVAFARRRIAAYKAPRRVIVVEHVQRAANGKGDYAWAKAAAEISAQGPIAER